MTDGVRALVLVLVGMVCGCINVLAGGGSFLTLGVLMEVLGLPAQVANATNRVGVLAGNLTASCSFARARVVKLKAAMLAALPATLGGVLGTWLALVVGDGSFRKLLAAFMVAASLLMLRGEATPQDKHNRAPVWVLVIGYALAGVYAGFVQAGVGFLMIGLTSKAGLDLVEGTALKTVTIVCLQTLSLALFAVHGSVDWRIGLWLALGCMIGAGFGARLTVLKGNRFIKRVVVLCLIAFALLLLLGE